MEHQGPILVAVPLQQAEHAPPGAEMPPPSHEQTQVADGVFLSEGEKALAAVVGMQTGLLLLHSVVSDHLGREDKEPEPRRRPATPPRNPLP